MLHDCKKISPSCTNSEVVSLQWKVSDCCSYNQAVGSLVLCAWNMWHCVHAAAAVATPSSWAAAAAAASCVDVLCGSKAQPVVMLLLMLQHGAAIPPGAPQSLFPVWSQIGSVTHQCYLLYVCIYFGIKASLLTLWHFVATETLLSGFEAASSCCGDTLVPLRCFPAHWLAWKMKRVGTVAPPRPRFLPPWEELPSGVAPLSAPFNPPPSLASASASLCHSVGSVNIAGTSWRWTPAKLRRAITGEVEHSWGDSVLDFTGMIENSEWTFFSSTSQVVHHIACAANNIRHRVWTPPPKTTCALICLTGRILLLDDSRNLNATVTTVSYIFHASPSYHGSPTRAGGVLVSHTF